MFKKVKDFNDRNNALYFFLAIIFLVVALFINNTTSKKELEKEEEKPKEEENKKVYKNYSYDIKININNQIVLFTVNVFNNKYLFTKTELGRETKYYVYYSDIYEQNALGNYVLYRDNKFVNDIDNKLLFLDYIKDIIDKSTKVESEDNCLINNIYNFTMCERENGYNIKSNLYEINYEIYNIDSTNDFDITIN